MKNGSKKNMLVIVGGPGSSGATTIAKMLSEHLNLERVYAGGVFRQKVMDLGYKSLEEFYFLATQEMFFDIDREVDAYLIEKAKRGNVLLDSKAFAAIATKKGIDCTVKIWLESSLPVRVKRMVGKQGELGFFRKIFLYISTFFNLANRRRADGRRYMELYGVEYSKPEKYNDIVLDTSNIDEKETFNLILEKFKDGRYFE